MTQSMIRRTLKNLVQNFSEAEVKVREATSNDPWGPSSSQMADISDLTYNVVACGEIMAMLWKRLNDDKNWRHVYKSLTLLEYLLKTGSDRIPKQSQENIHILKPLIEYRFIDKDGKDQGVNVREKAKMVLVLIQDEDKRKDEREFAMKTKDKLASSSSDSSEKVKTEVPAYTGLPCLDNIPSVADLTASMAKKKEEQRRLEEERKEAERRAKEGDTEPDLWEQAVSTATPSSSDPWGAPAGVQKDTGFASNDPWGAPSDDSKDSSLVSADPWGESVDGIKDSNSSPSDPWGGPARAEKQSPPAQNDPWHDSAHPAENKGPASTDPWATSSNLIEASQQAKADPWGPAGDSAEEPPPGSSDPWGTLPEPPAVKPDPWGGDSVTSAVSNTDPFADGAKADPDPWGTCGSSPLSANDPWGSTAAPAKTTPTGDPFGNAGSTDSWGAPTDNRTNGTGDLASAAAPEDSKKPPSFLGEGASLVDLDSLLSVKPKPKQLPLNALSVSGQNTQGILPSPKTNDCIIINSNTDIYSPLPSTQNVFGLAPMNVPSSLEPLSPTPGAPGAYMAPTAQGMTQNDFGLAPMTVPSSFALLNPIPGVPGPHMASVAHGTTLAGLSLPRKDVPSAHTTMQAGVMNMGSPNGGMPSLSLGEAVAQPMGVRPGFPQLPPLVWGPGSGKSTGRGDNNSLLF